MDGYEAAAVPRPLANKEEISEGSIIKLHGYRIVQVSSGTVTPLVQLNLRTPDPALDGLKGGQVWCTGEGGWRDASAAILTVLRGGPWADITTIISATVICRPRLQLNSPPSLPPPTFHAPYPGSHAKLHRQKNCIGLTLRRRTADGEDLEVSAWPPPLSPHRGSSTLVPHCYKVESCKCKRLCLVRRG
ncbi:hypothetical protein Pcinc_032448 [Petrolisthes cinctipes]|uniref:Uncharacterized protein n=1 Tax=Petrolisthes cinctipes TaxID=88211 RepID=A0AAE1EUE3_PETCI|nr:hypothetical protein Pcinc_032448 [Petrolisthes cinctipes]